MRASSPAFACAERALRSVRERRAFQLPGTTRRAHFTRLLGVAGCSPPQSFTRGYVLRLVHRLNAPASRLPTVNSLHVCAPVSASLRGQQ